MKLSDYVIKFVANLGIKHIFLLPGGGSMHLVDSVGSCKDIEYICNLHEQASAVAAEAYGQYTNNVGVVLVTSGPGQTNAITGVAGAWLDSTPCLFLSGQVKRSDLKGKRGVRQMGYQEIDITEMVKPITKYAVMVTDPATIRYHLEKGVYLATHGRPGPVWLDIPLDIQAKEINEKKLRGFNVKETRGISGARSLKQRVSETIRLFNRSERPVILAGNGIRLSGAIKEFLRLIEVMQAPVLTTWKTIDLLPEDHPLFSGRPGAVGQRGANFAQQNSDWLLALGARLDLGQTGYEHKNFALYAKKMIVDIDPTEIGKMEMPIDVSICADAGDFIREMLRQRGSINVKGRKKWLERCKDWQARYPVVLPEYWDQPEHVNNYAFIDALSDEMSEKDLLICGSAGMSSDITMQAFRVKRSQRIFNTQGLGSMGFGLPASIGGYLASGGRRTVCIEGDGGFMMNMQELETIRRLKLPIKIFVLNNQGYLSIRNTQKYYFKGRFVASGPTSGLTLPDISCVAESIGIHAMKIKNNSGIKNSVRRALKSPGPVVCEVMISPDQVIAPRVVSTQKPDGSLTSCPMEDMWPFLGRSEFKSNMTIPPV